MLKVLFVSSYVFPFAKTGGLADVSDALPKALKGIGVDVRLVYLFTGWRGARYLNTNSSVKTWR